MEVLGCYQFRVTRNSDLFVDDEEVDDLRRALEGELAHRRYGAAVRLEVSRDCPPDLDEFLRRQFTLNEVDFYEVSGPVNLNRLAALYDLVQRPDLKYPIFTPGLPRRVAGSTDLLAVIRQKDVLLHHTCSPLLPRSLSSAPARAARLVEDAQHEPSTFTQSDNSLAPLRQTKPEAPKDVTTQQKSSAQQGWDMALARTTP